MATPKNKEKSNISGMECFQTKIEEKNVILKQIEDNNAADSILRQKISDMEREIEAVRQDQEIYIQSLYKRHKISQKENIGKDNLIDDERLQDNERKKLASFRDTLIEMQETLSALDAEKESLGDEKNILQQRLSDFLNKMTHADVLKYQEKVSQARKDVQEITSVINEKMMVIDKIKNTPSPLKELKEKKEDILAENALGKNLSSELEQVEQQINFETKEIEARNAEIKDAQNALPGLQRKLSTAETALNKLESQKNAVLLDYLLAESEQIGREYIDAASILVEKYQKLTALNSLMVQLGEKGINGSIFHDFSVPAFNLKSFEGQTIPLWPNELVNARSATQQESIKKALSGEIERINGLGIEL